MFAIAFDLRVADTAANHWRGISQACAEIGATLADVAFARVQGSLYTKDRDDLANLFSALLALEALRWFPASVRDTHALKVEHWFDFTALVKEP